MTNAPPAARAGTDEAATLDSMVNAILSTSMRAVIKKSVDYLPPAPAPADSLPMPAGPDAAR